MLNAMVIYNSMDYVLYGKVFLKKIPYLFSTQCASVSKHILQTNVRFLYLNIGNVNYNGEKNILLHFKYANHTHILS